jgi:hypothetical protein
MARLRAKETNSPKPKKRESHESMRKGESEGSDSADTRPQSRVFSGQNRRIQDIGVDESDFASDVTLHHRIAEKAYLLYEASGFKHGNHLEHWFEAERQVKTLQA